MEFTIFIVLVLLFYGIVYSADKILKARNHAGYINLLNSLSIHISCMSVRWSTAGFNNLLVRLAGSKRLCFFRNWYNIGTYTALLLLLPSVTLLVIIATKSFLSIIQGSALSSDKEMILQPVVPGVNLPQSQLAHYFVTIFICTVFHEIGHALAAVKEQVPLIGVGLLVFFIIPAAFVELPTCNVTSLPAWRKLKIYAAGIWHNIVLTAVALVLWYLLPFIALPLFSTGSGVVIYSLNEYATGGSHDFQNGDILTRLDQCRVTDKDEWNRCLIQAFQESQLGFCATNSFFTEDHPVADNEEFCCPEDESNLCFRLLGKRQNYCLKARRVTETSSGRCHHQDDCPNRDDDCISLLVNDSSRLVRIERLDAEPVLYLGHYSQLKSSLSISNYAPRTRLFSPALMQFLEELLAYIASFSAGFAVLNIVPCIAMDGQHIVTAIVELLPGNPISPAKQRLTQLSIYSGTFLVMINVVCGLYNLLL